ncbi:MAG: hypothetical protein OXH46_10715 [Gemmatimonadetes bacterium]|nr:hypothetical protein [Gemmatimonadota bacterium]
MVRDRTSPTQARPRFLSAVSRGGSFEFFEDDSAGQNILYGTLEELGISLAHGLDIGSKLLGKIHDDVDEATVG